MHCFVICKLICMYVFVPFCLAVEEMAARPISRMSLLSNAPSDRLQTTSERSRPCSPNPLESVVTELFISEQNISKMGNILDTWSNNLKSNVLTELRKWKLAFMEQHKLEVRKEREKFAAQSAGLKSELDSLKGLLQTYETSSQRKDEAHAAQVAKQHYNLQLKKKVWLGWHSLIQKHWKVKVERACRARAEEVCTRLSSEYEAKLAEHCEALEKAQAEIQRLRLERERYEESMKKAFMRGVCALNMEALNMFQTTEAWPEQPLGQDQHDLLPPQEEAGSATLAQLHSYPISSTRFSPVHFDRPDLPLHSEADDGGCSQTSVSRTEVLPPTTVVHSSLPLGGIASSSKQVSSRVVTAGQQKPSKTVTARITARSDIGKASRGNLQVMGVAPPMSSVIVERHHPVTQVTVGQATAAKFPRPSQQVHSSTGRSSSKTYPSTSTCHVHSIKVVD
uniref:Centrosomal protein POC5 n=1 Tax=Sphaeramia orbicularis TaxID=375764 RepID=A0A673BYZ1_9TELE